MSLEFIVVDCKHLRLIKTRLKSVYKAKLKYGDVLLVLDEWLTLKHKCCMNRPDWLWRCVSHMDFCEAPQSYWNGRSSSVKSACFIITLGLSSHAVNQIWAHAFNPEVINVGHMTMGSWWACVSQIPKTPQKLAWHTLHTWVRFNLRRKHVIIPSVYSHSFDFL